MPDTAHKFHDRLDLKLTVDEYTSPQCGSLNAKTGKPEYCDFDCPKLKHSHARQK